MYFPLLFSGPGLHAALQRASFSRLSLPSCRDQSECRVGKEGEGVMVELFLQLFLSFFFFFNPLEFHVVAGSVLFMRSDSFFLLYTCVEVDLVDFTTVLKRKPWDFFLAFTVAAIEWLLARSPRPLLPFFKASAVGWSKQKNARGR